MLVGVGSYIVTDLIFKVYEASIDTIFLCCCVDAELHDGAAKPYFMSKNLMVSAGRHVDVCREAVIITHRMNASNRINLSCAFDSRCFSWNAISQSVLVYVLCNCVCREWLWLTTSTSFTVVIGRRRTCCRAMNATWGFWGRANSTRNRR